MMEQRAGVKKQNSKKGFKKKSMLLVFTGIAKIRLSSGQHFNDGIWFLSD